MPACWNAHMIRPEQSKAFGPAAPHEYGDPTRVSAACTTMADGPPGAATGTASGGAMSPGVSPGIGKNASGAAANTSGAGDGAASAVRWSGVKVSYCDLTAATCT